MWRQSEDAQWRWDGQGETGAYLVGTSDGSFVTSEAETFRVKVN